MAADLWSITSYFNPTQSVNRRNNYHTFRSRLDVPLVTVELAFDQPFELRAGDAHILIQVRGESVMWQKERLLNIALQHIPGQISNIAWLDCDVILENVNWPEEACSALQLSKIIQLFDESLELSNEPLPTDLASAKAQSSGTGLVSTMKTRSDAAEILKIQHKQVIRPRPGLAWAARRSLLSNHGFYDAFIIGGADSAMARAAFGWLDDVIKRARLNARQEKHYLEWAIPFHDAIQGNVQNIRGKLYHLWHGDFDNRQYLHRFVNLAAFDFDPEKDIAISNKGPWTWASHKPALHSYLKSYFESRNEDS